MFTLIVVLFVDAAQQLHREKTAMLLLINFFSPSPDAPLYGFLVVIRKCLVSKPATLLTGKTLQQPPQPPPTPDQVPISNVEVT